jgi:hypothetical protein
MTKSGLEKYRMDLETRKREIKVSLLAATSPGEPEY